MQIHIVSCKYHAGFSTQHLTLSSYSSFKLILLTQSNKEQLLDNGKSISNRKASKCKTVRNSTVATSVAEPDPNPDLDLPDPHVFRPPGSGSGSISLRYGSRSEYFYH
jgi:hypothetical protein